MDAKLIAVTVKLPERLRARVRERAKKQGKKLQSFYAELLVLALEAGK